MKCPRCHYDNPDDSKYCKECGTQLIPTQEIPASSTKTVETPKEKLITSFTFAGRYQITEELGKGEWVRSPCLFQSKTTTNRSLIILCNMSRA